MAPPKKKSAPRSKAKPAAKKAAAKKPVAKAKAKPAPKKKVAAKAAPKKKVAAKKTAPKKAAAPAETDGGNEWPPDGFPLVEGRQQLTAQWSIDVPGEFARRIDEGSLVLWRPGITVWLDAWGNNRGASREDRMAEIAGSISPEATNIRQSSMGDVSRLVYRLRDEDPEGPVEAVMSFTFSDAGHLQMGIYFDHPDDEAIAEGIAASVVLTTSDSFVS